MGAIKGKTKAGTPRQRRSPRKYVTYDYEEQYKQTVDKWTEQQAEEAIKKGRAACIYATKETYTGDQLAIDIYPEFTRAQAPGAGIRPVDRKKQREAQRRLNDKRSQRHFWELAEENFRDGDYWITLTYQDEPKSADAAFTDMQKFIRCINGKRHRRGLPSAKYLFKIETQTLDGEPVRTHIHLFMENGLTLDEIESTWKHGRRNECRKISKDENGIEGAATYTVKVKRETDRKKYERRWSRSSNLKEPEVKRHHQTKKKTVNEMVRHRDYIREWAETNPRYKGYLFSNSEVYYNEFNGRFYIRLRMRKEVKPDVKKAERQKTLYRRGAD